MSQMDVDRDRSYESNSGEVELSKVVPIAVPYAAIEKSSVTANVRHVGFVSSSARIVKQLEEVVASLKVQQIQKLEEEVATLKAQQLRAESIQSSSPNAERGFPTPQSWHDEPSGPEPTARDLQLLSPSTLSDLCDAWFEKYHSWFPILHKLSVLSAIQSSNPLVDSPISIVLKAVIAVTLPHWCLSNPLSAIQREHISAHFRSQVIMQAISTLSLQSLQALLITTILDYGAGKLSEFWNLVALCKKMGTQLGLRDLVANKCDNFNKLSTIPPRMLALPTTLIEQEEMIRAYWMTEALDSISSLGAGWNLSISQPENHESSTFPCNETVWTFPENASTAFSSFGDTEVSSAFSLYLNLVTEQLYQIHAFMQQSFDVTSAIDRVRRQAQCTFVDDTLTKWRTSVVTTQTLSQRNPASDSTIVMITVTYNTAVVALYQRLALPPEGLGKVHGPWYHAIQRCLSSCDDISMILRAQHDADLENMSPHLIFCIFVAARFYIAHAKVLSVETPRSLDLLVYALKTCSQRWYLARRLEKVLRHAIAEEKVPISMSSLPHQFYDLQYSSLDIDEALRVWADRELFQVVADNDGHGETPKDLPL
ncbi:uncharacterized protein LY89DRAFT_787201 [Mollisia scopiformis]|uniref:Xylanolytic transcriptional activator regulatory domain-containing protein n=1 Tax=Mollisia scopiformis TaxID=149040 RepID=A0A194WT94_MOLSC|nr:uncharacterized protein LY89DRAFT_787201 [Mollisia scopiformis]KUJ10837.1 hypothetical protein LY89DRAFT_787201 [Mollisia scopiformis]